MKWQLVIGLVVLLAATGVACARPTPTATGPPIEFVMKDKYPLGEAIEIRIRNTGDATYVYHQTYPACSDLKFYDDSNAQHQIGGKLFARRPLPPGLFIIPQGTHCDLPNTSEIRRGEEVALLTWHQRECITDAWGCVESVQVRPGTYRVVGEFYELERRPLGQPGERIKTVAEWTFVIACGEGEHTATGQADDLVRATPPRHTRLLPPPPPPGCEGPTLEISVNGDALQFDKERIEIAAGAAVELVFRNTSGVYQHNWVLVEAGTKDEVAMYGIAAGPGHDWIPPNDDRMIANTRLLNPGENGVVRFTAPPAGAYQFVCTFPGHYVTMFGDFMVTP